MDYSFYDFLMLVGSLGLFLFGMKMMSEGLQKAASKKLKEFLSAMSSHRYGGVVVGKLVTAIIQSS
jgi:phosphate:Na+ symporter